MESVIYGRGKGGGSAVDRGWWIALNRTDGGQWPDISFLEAGTAGPSARAEALGRDDRSFASCQLSERIDANCALAKC